MILLRADNNGEGGTLALMALAQRARQPQARGAIVLLGIISGALFYGDAVITPALSVLSAIEGIKVVTADVRSLCRAADGGHPGRAVCGAVARHRARRCLLRAGDVRLVRGHRDRGLCRRSRSIPKCCWRSIRSMRVSFMIHHGIIGFVTLGAVFLAVTGAEALYADLGHFGSEPIQTAWLSIVLPSLALNYLGQGALVLADPKAVENPFFLMFPDWALIPMVVLATVATVIASQAVITGAYSLTRQAIQLGLLPRLEIRHTSEAQSGQIYMPRVNLLLLHRRDAAGGAVPLVERAGLGLRHLGHRHHGGHGDDGVRRDLARLELVAAGGRRADRAVPVHRSRPSSPPICSRWSKAAGCRWRSAAW